MWGQDTGKRKDWRVRRRSKRKNLLEQIQGRSRKLSSGSKLEKLPEMLLACKSLEKEAATGHSGQRS